MMKYVELRNYAKELNLSCLHYLDGSMDCIFNPDQCHDILTIEIPALRRKNLSKHAQEVLTGLEFALNDTKSRIALLFEGN